METERQRERHVGWCVMHHHMVKDGGTWGVPRSGLIFMKTAKGWELTDVAPYLPEIAKAFKQGKDVPGTAEELRQYQVGDFQAIQRHNKTAGLEVTDPFGLLNKPIKAA